MLIQTLTSKHRSQTAHRALLAAAALMLPASVILASAAHAQSSTLPPVEVMQKKPKVVKKTPQKKPPVEAAAPAQEREPAPTLSSAPASSTAVTGNAIASQIPATNDTAAVVKDAPGVSLQSAGGVSSLPAIHGMASDRVLVMLNGMVIAPACGNHMNPPLSYMDPAQLKKIQVMAGITPVSSGGDSIGGTIVADSAGPRFAMPGQDVLVYGSTSVYGRTNGKGIGASGTVSAATSNVNVTYSGAWSRAENYKDGNGDEVRSTLYQAQNHMLSLAIRGRNDLLVVSTGVQHIPYQGFVNQYMDMTDNTAWFVNARYAADYRWGNLDVRAYYQNTQHEMNFLADKAVAANPAGMPMNTEGENTGYSVKAEIPLSKRDTLRVGNEFRAFRLDDWWPPAMNGATYYGMMGPDTYWNINDGKRDQLGTFLEWEAKWSRAWTTLLGVRNETIWTDAGDARPYNSMDKSIKTNMGQRENSDLFAAQAFNARDRTDVNFDLTALARFEPTATSIYEGGYSRKTRSPNLYERYTWGLGGMAMRMTGWFGDANGYVGDPDLKPEIAHTFSITTGWHDAGRKNWELKVTPYYTYVEDYIDVNRCPVYTSNVAGQMPTSMCNAANLTRTSGAVYLKFANHDAELYGVDVSGRLALLRSDTFGNFGLSGVLGFVHGKNLDTGDNLYHMMPLNAKLALQHKLGNWSNAVELQLVDDKDSVSWTRNELATPGYALVNLRTSYEFGQIRLDAGIENLLDKQYYSPLGGAYLGDTAAKNAAGTVLNPVAGAGRNFYAGLTVKF